MGSRPQLSLLLVVGALVLAFAIYVGDRIGAGVMRGVERRAPELSVTTMPVVVPSDEGGQGLLRLRRRSVLSVATDPAFPDPRITPEPTPVPTPRPTPRPTQTPRPSPSPSDDFDDLGTPPPIETGPPALAPGESPSPSASPAP